MMFFLSNSMRLLLAKMSSSLLIDIEFTVSCAISFNRQLGRLAKEPKQSNIINSMKLRFLSS